MKFPKNPIEKMSELIIQIFCHKFFVPNDNMVSLLQALQKRLLCAIELDQLVTMNPL